MFTKAIVVIHTCVHLDPPITIIALISVVVVVVMVAVILAVMLFIVSFMLYQNKGMGMGFRLCTLRKHNHAV